MARDIRDVTSGAGDAVLGVSDTKNQHMHTSLTHPKQHDEGVEHESGRCCFSLRLGDATMPLPWLLSCYIHDIKATTLTPHSPIPHMYTGTRPLGYCLGPQSTSKNGNCLGRLLLLLRLIYSITLAAPPTAPHPAFPP